MYTKWVKEITLTLPKSYRKLKIKSVTLFIFLYVLSSFEFSGVGWQQEVIYVTVLKIHQQQMNGKTAHGKLVSG